MPLVGGGGAGNTAGSNPAGTGTTLNYIGDHAYAMSGGIDVPQTITTLLNFSTSNTYVVAEFTFGNSSGSGDDMEYEVSIDSQKVLSVAVSGANAMPPNKPVILLPPYSNVLVTGFNLSSNTPREVFAVIAGRAYNA
tara:strand:+ start:107 stop:517 length:411 start_codon:yes stop_codon:yes gene_type:complete